jgi:hypothetical protein
MNIVVLPWEDLCAVIDMLQVKALSYMLEHADYIEHLID